MNHSVSNHACISKPPHRNSLFKITYLALTTTTTGDSLLVTNMRPFQIISAEKTIMARFSSWKLKFLAYVWVVRQMI